MHRITSNIPLDSLDLNKMLDPDHQVEVVQELMKFYEYSCKSASYGIDTIDVAIISDLLLLIRHNFGVKRHISGQLFYLRAIEIAKIVVEWSGYSSKVIYASFLYQLVRYTALPLSYVKEHYHGDVYIFVFNVLNLYTNERLPHSYLATLENRLEKAIKGDQIQFAIVVIKLAERLYDLAHASSYIYLTEIEYMAHETLTTDVPLANQYLGPELAAILKKTAKKALKICKSNSKKNTKSNHDKTDTDKDTDKDT